jgi:hypothetical protein
MSKWVIQANEGDPVHSYFSKKIARSLGSQHGWTTKLREATEFDSEDAAAAFAERNIQHVRTLIAKAQE